MPEGDTYYVLMALHIILLDSHNQPYFTGAQTTQNS